MPRSYLAKGEAQFTVRWLNLEDALSCVSESINEATRRPMDGDANQGRLYNLMTRMNF